MIIWSENIDGTHYEVRSAGASLRLYRNGVHHTQFNPRRPLSGGIWDLLTITALFRAPESLREALILGFGAGAAGRLLRELVAPESIVGIDIDPVHLSIADSFFECGTGCELMAADAIEWVRQTADDSRRYDWILDDLYTEEQGLPVRCGPYDVDWFRLLADRLTDTGMLVINLVEPNEVAKLPVFDDFQLKRRLPHVIQLSLTAYDNRVIALSRIPFEVEEFHQRIQSFYQTYPECRGVHQKYQIQVIS